MVNPDFMSDPQDNIFVFIYPANFSLPATERIRKSASEFVTYLSIQIDGDINNLKIVKDFLGKPYFENQDTLHFSVTHSGDYWACAFDTERIGIDLQQHVPCRAKDIAKRFFHREEYEYFVNHDQIVVFFSLWAAKESFVKYTGTGIPNSFHCFSAADKQGLREIVEEKGHRGFLTPVPFKENYSISVCSKRRKKIICVIYED